MSKEDKFFNKDQARALLLQTFDPNPEINEKNSKDNQQRMEVLIRFIRAIDVATKQKGDEGLTFSGLRPNDVDPLGNYLTTSGRMFFDLSGLDEKDRKTFNDFLFPRETENSIIKPRFVATHAIEKGSDNETLIDKKLKPLEALWRAIINKIFGKPREHYGMNIGIGGVGNKTKNPEGEDVTIQNNGEFGHLYINKNKDLSGIQVGFEEAGPGEKFIPGGGTHGVDGKGAEQSHCMTHRLQDYPFGPNGSDKIIPENDKNGPYSWNRITVTKDMINDLQNLKEEQLKFTKNNAEEIKEILNTPPSNCIEVRDYEGRNKQILEARQNNGLFVKKGIDENVEALRNLIGEGLSSYKDQQEDVSRGVNRANFYTVLFDSLEQETDYEKEEMKTLILAYALLSSTDGKTLKSEIGKSIELSPEEARQSLEKRIHEKMEESFPSIDKKILVSEANDIVGKIVETANTNPKNQDVRRIHAFLSDKIDKLAELEEHNQNSSLQK